MRTWVWILLGVALLAGACRQPPQTMVVEVTRVELVTAVPEKIVTPVTQDLFLRATEVIVTVPPTPPPTPLPKELIICQAAEPDSLYLYGSNMLDGQNVKHAIYENLTTQRNFGYQAQGIVKLPSLADGDAVINSVTVHTGDQVVDAQGSVGALTVGMPVVNASGEHIIFDGTPVELPQMEVMFTLKPLIWSDGVPVSASDSVFSFSLNRTAASAFGPVVHKARVEKTAVYEATGPLSIRWIGLPGYLDQTYFLNIWPPLPQHQLGEIDPSDLPDVPEAARFPLATGPFVVNEWSPGQHIQLIRNPYYYRSDEGLPFVDRVRFRFLPNPDQAFFDLLSGRCHIATRSVLDISKTPLLLASQNENELKVHLQPGTVFEHLDFGINSAADYGDGNGRPDWFEDVRVRRAVTLCIDRQRIIRELLFGIGKVLNTYVPESHPLYAEETAVWPYDPAAANALLEDVGLIDTNGDGIRESADGTPFSATYLSTTGAELRPAIAAIIVENLRDCGIDLTAEFLPGNEFFSDGPEGPLFGRRFDLAEFAWLTGIEPPCANWLSANITGLEGEGAGGWRNLNNTGWAHAGFDGACMTALSALPGQPAYTAAHQEAMRILSEELPIVPLFQRVFAAAARPEVNNFGLDPTQPSELWNLYELDIES